MTTTQGLMTAEDLWNQPDDGNKHELVRGELRTMAPAGFEHGNIGMQIAARLYQHVKVAGLGVVVPADTGFVIARDPDTVRAPDVGFVSQERIRTAGITKEFFPGSPDLAVEVISPSDTLYEVEEKVHDWLTAGTRIVWVVNPKRRTVTIHKPGPQVKVLTEKDPLSGEDVVPGFTCIVSDLFFQI